MDYLRIQLKIILKAKSILLTKNHEILKKEKRRGNQKKNISASTKVYIFTLLSYVFNNSYIHVYIALHLHETKMYQEVKLLS